MTQAVEERDPSEQRDQRDGAETAPGNRSESPSPFTVFSRIRHHRARPGGAMFESPSGNRAHPPFSPPRQSAWRGGRVKMWIWRCLRKNSLPPRRARWRAYPGLPVSIVFPLFRRPPSWKAKIFLPGLYSRIPRVMFSPWPRSGLSPRGVFGYSFLVFEGGFAQTRFETF